MPPLYEGSSLYMPTALPGISITQASTLLQEQDRIIRSFPEVESVFGAVGRSDSPTDNAPLDMYDTTIMLKPREQWRAGDDLRKADPRNGRKASVSRPDEYLDHARAKPPRHGADRHQDASGNQDPGPERRRDPAGGCAITTSLGHIPELRSIFAERVAEGFYINIEVNRLEAARYGLTVGDVQRAVTSGIGGENIAENIEGRERYPINVRYSRDFRDDIEELQACCDCHTQRCADSHLRSRQGLFQPGPAMIRDEDGLLTGYVYIDLETKDYGGFVGKPDRLLREKLSCPPDTATNGPANTNSSCAPRTR